MNTSLNLTEDTEKIKEVIKNYLIRNSILNWKYEHALNELISKNLSVDPTEENMKILGDVYLKQVLIICNQQLDTCNEEEKRKIGLLELSFDKICTSSQVLRLLHLARFSGQALDEAVCGEQGYLDLMNVSIPNRFGKSLFKVIEDLNLKLQPSLTRPERDMLLEISSCTNVASINQLLSSLYANTNMSAMCRYIRLALSTIVKLWSSDSLLSEHNESWFRTHVYGPIFDNAFLYDKEFITKRADCISNITKE
ncbi:hypothetical protein EDC94DRAFT_673615, partial [Helicostylum pulchrum]